MPIDKSRVEEFRHESTTVLDDSLKGKKINAIDKPGVSLDFEDEGIKSVPQGAKIMFCSGQKVPSEKFKNGYDNIAWSCDKCNEMHPKGEECK